MLLSLLLLLLLLFVHKCRQLSGVGKCVEGLLIIATFQSSCWTSGIVVMEFDFIRASVILRGCAWKIRLTHNETERRLSMPIKSAV